MIISPDHFLIDLSGLYVWSPERSIRAWGVTSQIIHSHLPYYERLVLLVGLPGAGKSTWLNKHEDDQTLFVDATFTNIRVRHEILKISFSHQSPCDAIWFQTPYEICCQRNSLRSPNRRVPEGTMCRFHNQLSAEPPTYQEGFREIYTIF